MTRSPRVSPDAPRPKAVWTGTLSFGLVAVPVRLYAAARAERITFNQLCGTCHSRIKQQLFCPACNEVRERKDLDRGYEYAKDTYLLVSDTELEAIEPPTAKLVEIQEFISASAVDPIYFESSFYLCADAGGEKALTLLRSALENAGYVGIAKLTLHGREHVIAVRPFEAGLVAHTLFFPSEIRPIAFPVSTAATEGEVAICKQLVEALAAEFDPQAYRDAYVDAIRQLIASKVDGKVLELPRKPAAALPVSDVMGAIGESIRLAKQKRKAS